MGRLGSSWGRLGASWGCLGGVLGRLELSWTILRHLGPSWGRLEGLGRFGTILGPSWDNFGDQIEVISEPLSGPFLGPVFHYFLDFGTNFVDEITPREA